MGQEMIHFSTIRDWAVCKSWGPRPMPGVHSLPTRAAFLTPSHSPALRSSSAPCAALPDAHVTLGSSTATVPCHIAGCQDQHCHRHEAWPDRVYVTSLPSRSHYFSNWWKRCTVSRVCAVLSTKLLHISFTINAEVNKICEEIFDSKISMKWYRLVHNWVSS